MKTLIRIFVVVVILVVLAGMFLPALSSAKEKAKYNPNASPSSQFNYEWNQDIITQQSIPSDSSAKEKAKYNPNASPSSQFNYEWNQDIITQQSIPSDSSAKKSGGRFLRGDGSYNAAMTEWSKKMPMTSVSKDKFFERNALRLVTEPNIVPMPEFNTTEYKGVTENGFRNVATSPLLTFGADVDTAGYAMIRSTLQRGQKMPTESVRAEELINYFSYDYKAPEGKDKFSVTFEMGDAPWAKGHKLLLIGMQAKKVDVSDLPPSNFVFLIDNSGSMSEEMPMVRESMKTLAKNLRSCDCVSIVTYGGGVNTLLDGVSGRKQEQIMSVLNSLSAGGFTPGGSGIQTAYKLAHDNFIKGGNNRIVLITDGDFNVGVSSESDLVAMVEKERSSSIYLTAIGTGMGNYKDNKLKMLANKGNGNYLYLDNMNEAREAMLKEMNSGRMFTLAKDVKFQIEFNPAQIKSYRQIGYEMRKLEDRDFKDDTKDSGEVCYGHQVTVLCELVMTDSEETNGVDPLKYSKTESTGSKDLLTCKIRYQEPEGGAPSVERVHVVNELPQPGANLRWAGHVAEFALALRDSEYKGTSDLQTLRQRAQAYLGNDPDGRRAEFLTMVKNAASVYAK